MQNENQKCNIHEEGATERGTAKGEKKQHKQQICINHEQPTNIESSLFRS